MNSWLRQHSAAVWPACVLLTVCVVTAVLWDSANDWRDTAEKHGGIRDRMKSLVAEYESLEAKANVARTAAPPRETGLTFGTLEQIARQGGLITPTHSSVQDMREGSPEAEGGVSLRTITLKLSSITVESLAKFLAKVEALSPYVFTETLRITRNKRIRSRIDAKISVSAYEKIENDSS